MQNAEHIVSDVEVPALPRRPYPGLRPFTLEEDAIFFGREPMIDEIIDLLAQRCLILVHGSSGSGKSSLVLAGVLPRLARQHRRHGWRWRTASIRPGGGPLWNLASALAELEGAAPSAARVDELRLSFDRTGADLTEIVTHLAGMEQERLCLLVDQFEELFRFARETSREESRLFVDLITTVLKQDSASPVRVILTMRSEFLGECARLPGLAGVVNTAQYLLPRMDTASLHRAIRRPAELYGGKVTSELADRLIADVQGSQDELPLIQHGLMRLWDLADKAADDEQAFRHLDLPLYEAHGPLPRLLDRHAEAIAVAAASDNSSRRVVEDIFRALSDINVDGQAIRRPQSLQSLIAVTGAKPGRLTSILDAFRSNGVSFVTPYAPARLRNETMIDISHEALIRCWNSLAAAPDGWLHREFRDGLIWRSLLSQAEIFEKDQRKVLGPATTGDREAWLKDRTPAWSERYGGGWTRVQRLMAASRTAADLQYQRRRRYRLLRLVTPSLLIVVLIFGALSGLLWTSITKAARNLQAAKDSAVYLVSEVVRKMRPLVGVDTAMVLDMLGSAKKTFDQLEISNPGDRSLQGGRAALFNEFGNIYRTQDDLPHASEYYDRSRKIMEPLVRDVPSNASWERNLFVSYAGLGEVLKVQFNLPQALKYYQAAQLIGERFAKTDPTDVDWQRDLSASYVRVGEVLQAQGKLSEAMRGYLESLDIMKRLAQAHPGDVSLKAALSASYIRVGDARRAQGNLPEALQAYRTSHDIAERQAKIDPSNAPWQYDLGSSDWRIGNVQGPDGLGDLPEALQAYRAGLAIMEGLAAADRANALWQRRLAQLHGGVGDVLQAQHNLPEALKSYQAAQSIGELFAKTDPTNVDWQFDLSISYGKVGDVLQTQGKLPEALKSYGDSLAIVKALAEANPSNTGWQRDLSISYEKVGDALKAQGNLPEALKSYQATQSIGERLAKTDPTNVEWQFDLSISDAKVGDVLAAQGNLPEALKSYRDCQAIRERLAQADPENVRWRDSLRSVIQQIGGLEGRLHQNERKPEDVP